MYQWASQTALPLRELPVRSSVSMPLLLLSSEDVMLFRRAISDHEQTDCQADSWEGKEPLKPSGK